LIAIRARRVFDGERIVPRAETVLLEGSRIAGVQPSGMPLPDGCEVVDHRRPGPWRLVDGDPLTDITALRSPAARSISGQKQLAGKV
jgi:hypothetical protein